jgi:hypothetical protein
MWKNYYISIFAVNHETIRSVYIVCAYIKYWLGIVTTVYTMYFGFFPLFTDSHNLYEPLIS